MVEFLFGKEHVLNMPNCILGIIFYTMQLLLGKLISIPRNDDFEDDAVV